MVNLLTGIFVTLVLLTLANIHEGNAGSALFGCFVCGFMAAVISWHHTRDR